MCFYCPADLAIEEPGVTIRFRRIAEDAVTPADVTDDARELAEFEAGDRFLVALQVTLYVQNRPVITEELHGIAESDAPGELACAFEDQRAVARLLLKARASAAREGYLRQNQWVL